MVGRSDLIREGAEADSAGRLAPGLRQSMPGAAKGLETLPCGFQGASGLGVAPATLAQFAFGGFRARLYTGWRRTRSTRWPGGQPERVRSRGGLRS